MAALGGAGQRRQVPIEVDEHRPGQVAGLVRLTAGTPVEAYVSARMDFWASRGMAPGGGGAAPWLQHVSEYFRVAWVTWALWTWSDEALVPFGAFADRGAAFPPMHDAHIITPGHHGALRDDLIRAALPPLLAHYTNVRITNHLRYCTRECAATQAWDGNMKF